MRIRSRHVYARIVAASALVASFAFAPLSALAAPPQDKFVRTAVPFMKQVSPSEYDALARYDLVILPAELQLQGRALFDALRSRNPDIVILAYFPTKSYILGWGDTLHAGLRAGIQDGWWLRSTEGAPISVWPGTQALSATTGWSAYLTGYVHDRVLGTGYWDGIFYDEVSGDISWVNGGNVDLDRDGVRDGARAADDAWKAGMVSLLAAARRLDPDKVFVINGSSTPEFQALVNGRMFESFPTPWEANGDWYEIMRRYTVTQTQVARPEMFVVNANTGNTGNLADYRKVRFSVASTLLGNGYFSFDYGDQDHGQLWWYDEYDAALGKPAGSPKNLDAPADPTWKGGVWQRDYANGVALVNPTGSARTVTFSSEYEKLRGAQDPRVNDGSIVSQVTIPARDGLIMLRPLDKLTGAPYVNGAYARVFDAGGAATRTGFFAYDGRFRGSAQVLEHDLDGDGRRETIVAERDAVRVLSPEGAERFKIAPFGVSWRGGMEVAVGDVDGDGALELVIAAGPGGTPQVRIYDRSGREEGSFFAYHPAFRGGVHLAVGNTDTDAAAEIVTGAGPGGGPHVRVFTHAGIVKYQFFAYDQRFRGGAHVAVGDVLGIGRGQVVTGAGFGGGPHVRIIDVADGNRVVGSFFAFNSTLRSGVRVAAADTDGNGKAEVFGMSTDVFTVTSLEAPTPEAEAVPDPAPVEDPPAFTIDPLYPERPLFLGMKP